jgi:hypothetical protein
MSGFKAGKGSALLTIVTSSKGRSKEASPRNWNLTPGPNASVGRISYGNVEFSACLGDNNGGERVSDDLASDMKRSMPIRTPSERDRKRRSDK